MMNGSYINNLRFKFLLVLLGFIACTDHRQSPKPEEYAWLFEANNLTDTAYESKYAQALKKYTASNEPTKKAYILIARGNALDYHLQADSTYLQSVLSFVNQHETDIEPTVNQELHYYIGSQYDMVADIEPSRKWLLRTLNLAPNEGNQITGLTYQLLSNQYLSQSSLDSAQHYALRAEALYERMGDTANLSGIQNNVFRIATKMHDEEGARRALRKMIDLGWQAKDTDFVAAAYLNLGTQSTRTDSSFASLGRYLDTLDMIAQQWKQPTAQFAFMHSMLRGLKNIHDGNLAEADSNITLCKKIGEGNPHAQPYIDNLELYYITATKGSYDKEQFDKVVENCIKNRDYFKAMNFIGNAVQTSVNQNNYKEAYHYQNEKYALRDSLWDDQLKSKLIEFEKKYQTAKKEKTIAQQSATITKRNYLAGSLGLGMISSVLLFILISNRRKQQALQRENKLQTQYSQDLFSSVEQERSRIAGELHDDVNHQVLQLSNKVKEGSPLKESEIQTLMQKIRSISHELYPAMIASLGLPHSIEQLCHQSAQDSNLQIVHDIKYPVQLSKNEELQIYRIIQEALNNIIKHSGATHAVVLVSTEEGDLQVQIKDNGTGFDTQSEEILSSFGLANMRQRAKSINGKIHLHSSPEGTQVKLTVDV